MILVCPSCGTKYTLPDAKLGDTGRNVRCRACGHSWFAKPQHQLEVESSVQDDSGLTRAQVERLRQKAQSNAEGKTGPHAEIREKERKKRARNRMIAATFAWVLGGAILVGAGISSFVYREQVVQMWPKTASVFAMAGLEVNRFGLEFTDLAAQRSFDGTTPILTITGEVKNVSETHRPAPLVQIKLMTETGEPVHTESVSLFDEVVPPGASSGFSARIVSPPMDSYNLDVHFKSDDGPGAGEHSAQTTVHGGGHGAEHVDGYAGSHSEDHHPVDSHDDGGHHVGHASTDQHDAENHNVDAHNEPAPLNAEDAGHEDGTHEDDGHH